MRKQSKKNNKLWLALIAALSMTVVGVSAFYLGESVEAPESVSTPVASKEIVKGSATTDSTEEQLLYLIEEEKLAHDVYTKMYELYGARVFGNILNSESSHQASVLVLLNSRDIADPRSSEIGVFKNQELQALYNKLIAKGNKSAQDAYEVGVIIEERDIKDISEQLKTAKESDVITTLETLRRGSENHLRAFNRQL